MKYIFPDWLKYLNSYGSIGIYIKGGKGHDDIDKGQICPAGFN